MIWILRRNLWNPKSEESFRPYWRLQLKKFGYAWNGRRNPHYRPVWQKGERAKLEQS